jgi:hypothetical protein
MNSILLLIVLTVQIIISIAFIWYNKRLFKVIELDKTLLSLCAEYQKKNLNDIILNKKPDMFSEVYELLPPYSKIIFSNKDITLSNYVKPQYLKLLFEE